MKKNVPFIINQSIEYNLYEFMDLHIQTIQRDINNDYYISNEDLEIAIAIGQIYNWADKIEDKLQRFSLKQEVSKEKVKFHKLTILNQLNLLIKPNEKLELRVLEMAMKVERKKIVEAEIARTNLTRKEKNLRLNYLETLLNEIREFPSELTLIATYIPITLSFNKLVHILIKHFEETKFGEGQFKKRTFFDYNYKQFLTLLKAVLNSEMDFIISHFRKIYLIKNHCIEGELKSYINNSISYNGDAFQLVILPNGKIDRFHQI